MKDPEFPLDPELIYLNHAGVAPWSRVAAEAVKTLAEENMRWGAADYPVWTSVESQLRDRLARFIGVTDSADIALVKNTSEGLSMVALGLDWQPGDNVVINDQEFPSNRMVWEAAAERFGVELRDVRLDAAETPEDALIDAMDERTRILPVSSVQYATGLRMDLDRLGRACHDLGALFCVDAIQSLGALPFDAPAVGADFVIADGHKWMLAPEGLGLFYSRPEARDRLRLIQYGWHMAEAMGDYERKDWTPARSARRFEPGSPNTLAVHALNASLALLEERGMARVGKAVLDNARHLLERIAEIPALEAVTPAEPGRHAGIVTFKVAGAEARALNAKLRRAGVVAAHRGGGLRFSPHFYTPREALDTALERVLALT